MFYISKQYISIIHMKLFYRFVISILAERLKRDLDNAFGHPWHVIVGESFSFEIEYDSDFFHYFFYGPVAVLAFKVKSE